MVMARSWVMKGLRGAAANLVGGLRVDASGGGQRVGAGADACVAGGEEDEALGADVAGGAVADAIGGDEDRAGCRESCRWCCRRSAGGRAVEFDFHDEVRVGSRRFPAGPGCGSPRGGVAFEGAGERDLGDGLVWRRSASGRRRRGWGSVASAKLRTLIRSDAAAKVAATLCSERLLNCSTRTGRWTPTPPEEGL